MEFAKIGEISFIEIIFLFVLSLALVYSYMNVIIHQLGFYELFFTDIMLGNVESERIANEFLSKYGNKHRHFGHGALHGLITAFITALPFIGSIAILEQRSKKYVLHHFSYWLVTSIIVGGFISEFI